ncbi:hypothetical protein ACIOHS_47350 [Streptomyces sp. NPDC088253]|uniref:hypothetical protein n=1 Tax=Streptomyces sp. NPDC088253 TaxID=3365846 RepID=UPI003827E03C
MATYEFPPKLIDDQNELDQVRADLKDLFKRVPWSVEPMDAWETHENAWRPASRPARLGPGGRRGDRPAAGEGTRTR